MRRLKARSIVSGTAVKGRAGHWWAVVTAALPAPLCIRHRHGRCTCAATGTGGQRLWGRVVVPIATKWCAWWKECEHSHSVAGSLALRSWYLQVLSRADHVEYLRAGIDRLGRGYTVSATRCGVQCACLPSSFHPFLIVSQPGAHPASTPPSRHWMQVDRGCATGSPTRSTSLEPT